MVEDKDLIVAAVRSVDNLIPLNREDACEIAKAVRGVVARARRKEGLPRLSWQRGEFWEMYGSKE